VIKTHAQTPGNTTVENCENMQVHKTKPHASAAGSSVHTRNLIKKKNKNRGAFAVFPGTNTLLHFNAAQMRRRGEPGHMDNSECECECEL